MNTRRNMMQSARQLRMHVAVLSFTAFAVGGCGKLYLHSDGLESLAKETRGELQGVFEKDLAGGLSGQIKDDQAFALDVLRSLSAASNETQLNTLLSHTWDKLLDKAEEHQESVDRLVPNVTGQLSAIDNQLATAVQKHAGAKKASVNAGNALAEAQCGERRYAATQDLLSGLVNVRFSQSTDGGKMAVRELLARAPEAASDSFDVQGQTAGCQNAETVAELLGLDRAVHLLDGAGSGGFFDTLEAVLGSLETLPQLGDDVKLALRDPGLSTVILGLGFDVAVAAELRLKAEVDYWRALKQLRTEQLGFAKDWQKRLVEAVTPGRAFSLRAMVDERDRDNTDFSKGTVGEGLRGLALEFLSRRAASLAADENTRTAAQQATQSARDNLRLALIVTAKSYENLFVMANAASEFDSRAAILKNARSAEIATAILKEREAVLGRGLEGLVAFHEGGINAEDIRGLIGLAQFAALLAIAEGN